MVILNSDGYAAYACDTYFERWAAGSPSSPSPSPSSAPSSSRSSSFPSSSSSLTQVTLWLCGEFALRRKSNDAEINLGDFDSPIDETKLLGMIDRILTTSDDGKIKSYALTALAKLYPRCAAASNKDLIRKMMKCLDADVNVEIQTRSVEYGKVCGANDSSTSETVFAAVPKLEGMGGGADLDLDLEDDGGARDSLDLTALLSLDEEAISSEGRQGGEGGGGGGGGEGGPPAPVYEDAFVRLYVEDIQRDVGSFKFTVRYEAALGKRLAAFRVQAAVPKQMKLRLDPPSGNALGGSVCVTQKMAIEGASGDAIVMKVRLNFEDGGEQVTNIAEVRVVVT